MEDKIEMLKMYSSEALVKELRSREEIAQVTIILNHTHTDLYLYGRDLCDKCYNNHCKTLSPPQPYQRKKGER